MAPEAPSNYNDGGMVGAGAGLLQLGHNPKLVLGSTPVMISIFKPASVLCGACKSALRISSQIQRRKAALTGGIPFIEVTGHFKRLARRRFDVIPRISVPSLPRRARRANTCLEPPEHKNAWPGRLDPRAIPLWDDLVESDRSPASAICILTDSGNAIN
jgi:hypothetical protein